MKKTFAFLFALLLTLALCILPAGAEKAAVTDDAGLLTQEEEQALSQRVSQIYDTYHFQVVLHTTLSTGNKTVRDYAADFYDSNGFGYGSSHDGLIYMISMAERDYMTVTTGSGITIFTDYGIELIEKDVVSLLSDGEYYAAFDRYLTDAEKLLEKAAAGVPADVDSPVQLYSPAERATSALPVLVFIAVIVTVIVLLVMVGQMKTARKKDTASDYVADIDLMRRADIYLYSTETRRKIETESGSGHSGGGSSTFTGSSGTSHGGGGGGKF